MVYISLFQILFESRARPDLYIVTKSEDKLKIYYINFDGPVFHTGHKDFCPFSDSDFTFKTHEDEESLCARRDLYLNKVLNIHPDAKQNVELHFRNISSCEYNLCHSSRQHRFHPSDPNLPACDPYYWMKSNFPSDLRFYDIKKKVMSHKTLVENIENGTLHGFVLLSGFGINEIDRNPMFGFCIEKATVKSNNLSRELLLGKNYFSKPVFIHTNYFNWLRSQFITNEDFIISHFFEFSHFPYFKQIINNSVNKRAIIKHKLSSLKLLNDPKQNEKISSLEAASALLKLKCNGLYGYTMLSSAGYLSQKIYSGNWKQKRIFSNGKNPVYCFPVKKIKNKTFISIIYSQKEGTAKYNKQRYGSLVSIGSCILFQSKVIFFSSILFLLKTLDHHKSELIYWDTDSIMMAVCFPSLVENLLEERKDFFEKEKNKYIFLNENESPSCGVLVFEEKSDSIILLGEKIYQKIYQGKRNSKAKSVPNAMIKSQLNTEEGDNFYNRKHNSISSVRLSCDFKSTMQLNYVYRQFVTALNPMKREFREQHSVTYN